MQLFKNFKRKAKTEIALHCVVSAVFMLVALSYLYILVWTFIAGLRTNDEVILDPFGLPSTWNWYHYIEVFQVLKVKGTNFFGMFLNSVWFSCVGPFLQQFVTCLFAYTCTKYKFPGSGIPYVIVLLITTLPIYGNSGALYKMYHAMGLIDSYARCFLMTDGINMHFLYYSAYFKNLSWTYAEAAKIDGANDFQTYLRVMFPQAKPIFGALFLTSWLTQWNNYESGLVYFPNLPTLPVGIYLFNQEMIYQGRMDILFAACFLVSLPAIILFIVFNKTLTSSVSVGGVKG